MTGTALPPGLKKTCRLLTNGVLKPLIVATAQTKRSRNGLSRDAYAAFRALGLIDPTAFDSKRLAARHSYGIVGESLDVQSYHRSVHHASRSIARRDVLAHRNTKLLCKSFFAMMEAISFLKHWCDPADADRSRRRRLSVDIDASSNTVRLRAFRRKANYRIIAA
ncbi:hypothetical protein [Bradyrhizobium sp. CIR3A]|uniref:hypothetical protein n=1 Tax=Bradyrhizobium sp. CIR3A TaxID=2663838 RepID=UPI0016061018|nr:hypothetical protein [Bradyrhizobium sp. CIR3A]MBB4258216.1 hypothetical protein [Bradyrhizobium sp. CIR3A]